MKSLCAESDLSTQQPQLYTTLYLLLLYTYCSSKYKGCSHANFLSIVANIKHIDSVIVTCHLTIPLFTDSFALLKQIT